MAQFAIKSVMSAMILPMILVGGLVFRVGAAEDASATPRVDWSFSGAFGTYDRNALRRGFQVYKEVCASCHALEHIWFRNLSRAGGPEFSEAEVKAIAAEYSVTDGPDAFGDMFDRPGLPRDRFVAPYPNKNAARAANGGSYPPDLSLITKARSGGPDYIHALLTGYKEKPADMQMRDGFYYNPYMPGGVIAMPAPLVDDLVDYADGTPATVEQMSLDVTHFLNWTAEPELEARKRIGFMVMIYLLIFTGLMYFSMRKIWADKH